MGSTIPAAPQDPMLDAGHAVLGAMLIYVFAVLFVAFVLSVLILIAEWRVFSRGGCPGWAVLVPFYNTYCLFKLLFGNGWLFLLLLVPVVNWILCLVVPFRLSHVFGAGFGFGLGLFFLPAIFMLILGFGRYCYSGPN